MPVLTTLYWHRLSSCRSPCTCLQLLSSALQAMQEAGIKLYTYSEFLSLGEQNPAPPTPPKPDDLCTIM